MMRLCELSVPKPGLNDVGLGTAAMVGSIRHRDYKISPPQPGLLHPHQKTKLSSNLRNYMSRVQDETTHS